MPELSFQFIIFLNPFIFWGGFLLFFFLTLPFNSLLEAGCEKPYSFPFPLKILHSFFRFILFFLLWCLLFEVFFLKSPEEEALSAIDRQWKQIIEEKKYINFIDSIWKEEGEQLPECPKTLWTWHGKITEMAFLEYRKCVVSEFVALRTGTYPKEESIEKLIKEIIQYTTSSFIWDGYVEKIDKFTEKSSFLKNISELTIIQKIQSEMDIDTTHITTEVKNKREKQKRQLNYSIDRMKENSDFFLRKNIQIIEKTQNVPSEKKFSIPESAFTIQPLFPVVPIMPDESTKPHISFPLINDYIGFPASKQ